MKLIKNVNCIQHIKFIETKANIYIVTEWVEDGDLFDYIKSKKFLDGISLIYFQFLFLFRERSCNNNEIIILSF